LINVDTSGLGRDIARAETFSPAKRTNNGDTILKDKLMSTPVEGKNGGLVPIATAIAIALAGTAAMFLIEFRPTDDAARNGVSMISAASADRAGATAHPTEPVAR